MRTPFGLLISSDIVFGFQAKPIAKCPPSTIPSSTQYVMLQKNVSRSSLVFESGTANSLETTNSKPPGPIIVIGQLETWSSNQIIFYYALLSKVKTYWAKTILQSQTSMI
jgi:hypothetical protein